MTALLSDCAIRSDLLCETPIGAWQFVLKSTVFTFLSFFALAIACFCIFFFLSLFTGLPQAQSGGAVARLKLARKMSASSNPSSNLPPTFTSPNKSKWMMFLSFILFSFSHFLYCVSTRNIYKPSGLPQPKYIWLVFTMCQVSVGFLSLFREISMIFTCSNTLQLPPTTLPMYNSQSSWHTLLYPS